jgi:hypothetical protein
MVLLGCFVFGVICDGFGFTVFVLGYSRWFGQVG